MGTILASAIIDKAEIILQDITNVRWSAAELLVWLNDGQREIVARKPDTYVLASAVLLTAGTRQAAPAGTVQLIDIPYNMGTGGATPGAQIRVLPRQVMDDCLRDWRSAAQATDIEVICFDPRDPLAFDCYPPSNGTGYVWMVRVGTPADIGAGTAITVGDIYAVPLMHYIIAQALMQDSDFTPNTSRAQAHLGLFLNGLGAKEATETAGEPA